MSPISRAKRPNGRHETGGQTVPDIAPEESMTQPAPVRKAAPAEVLEDLLSMHEAAQLRVREASGGIAPLEEQIRTYVSAGDELRGEAEDLRKKAAEADLRADNQFAAATALGKQRDGLREEARVHQARADYHGSRIDEEIALGAEDPAGRRKRLAEEETKQRTQASSHPGFPQVSPLDTPNPPLPTMTQPWPAHEDLDKAQAVRAEGGGT